MQCDQITEEDEAVIMFSLGLAMAVTKSLPHDRKPAGRHEAIKALIFKLAGYDDGKNRKTPDMGSDVS